MTKLDAILVILLGILTMLVVIGNIVLHDMFTFLVSVPPYAIAWYFFVKYYKRLRR